jgi:L-lactate dehydrogenase
VHGGAEVFAWSVATIRGSPITQALSISAKDRADLEDQCKDRPEMIFQAKGSTPYGISSVVYMMCAAILADERKICPVSHFQPEYGVCMSLPVVLGRRGISGTIQMPLSNEEVGSLAESAKGLQSLVERVTRENE